MINKFWGGGGGSVGFWGDKVGVKQWVWHWRAVGGVI